MFKSIKNWFRQRDDDATATPSPAPTARRRASVARQVNRQRRSTDNEELRIDGLDGEIESLGPGKNVLIRNRFVREEAGTHEKLKILDDSYVDSGEETGIDPYNTGGFDRSRNWDTRFRK